MLCQKNFLPVLLFGVLVSSCGYKDAEVYKDPARGYIRIIPSSVKVQELSRDQYAVMTRASSRHEQALQLLESCISLSTPDKASYRTMTPHHCVEEKRHLDDALELVNVLHKLKSSGFQSAAITKDGYLRASPGFDRWRRNSDRSSFDPLRGTTC